MYRPATHRQLLDGNHVKRAIQAHMTTLLALFSLYQEAFFEKFPTLKNTIQIKANALDNIFKVGETDSVSTLDDVMNLMRYS